MPGMIGMPMASANGMMVGNMSMGMPIGMNMGMGSILYLQRLL